MPKSIAQAKEEEARLGRITPQMGAQEDTLASLSAEDFATETTLDDILSQFDITLSALRDTLRGTPTVIPSGESWYIPSGTEYPVKNKLTVEGKITVDGKVIVEPYKDLFTIETDIESIYNKLNSQLDITSSTLRDALLSGTVSYPGGLDDIYNKLNTQLDVLLSTRASETTLGNIKTKTDNIPSDPAREGGNLATILARLDITLSALRDALKGASSKDFTTLETELDKKADEATAPNEYTVTLTNADTEYSQALPTNTRAFEFWARESVDIRFAFTSGKVATPTEPYFTLKAGTTYYKENLNLSGKSLYLACGEAGKHVEIIAWT